MASNLKSLNLFGRVVLAKQTNPLGFVVFYPPATGDKGQQALEAVKLSEHGIASLLYTPPYLKNAGGGLLNPDVEVEIWKKSRAEFSDLKKAIVTAFPGLENQLGVVGKNLGGSIAAYSVDESVKCLIVSGSVPELSKFWTESENPIAVKERVGISSEKIAEFRQKTKSFDLINTLSLVKAKINIQFGKKDPWIDETQANIFSDKYASHIKITWTDDDHAMISPLTSVERVNFITQCLDPKLL